MTGPDRAGPYLEDFCWSPLGNGVISTSDQGTALRASHCHCHTPHTTPPQNPHSERGGFSMHVASTPLPASECAALRLHGQAESYSGLSTSSLYVLASRGEIRLVKAGG